MFIEPSAEERFWSKVTRSGKNECWQWVGAISKSGYGILLMPIGRKRSGAVKWGNRLAHRVSFALQHGVESLRADLHIAHACHNRACVNPAHLSQVTPGENVRQSRLDGRTARGTKFKNSKLTDSAVKEIRKVAKDIDGEAAMMVKYRVSQVVIQSVYKRKAWKHVV